MALSLLQPRRVSVTSTDVMMLLHKDKDSERDKEMGYSVSVCKYDLSHFQGPELILKCLWTAYATGAVSPLGQAGKV